MRGTEEGSGLVVEVLVFILFYLFVCLLEAEFLFYSLIFFDMVVVFLIFLLRAL